VGVPCSVSTTKEGVQWGQGLEMAAAEEEKAVPLDSSPKCALLFFY